MNRKHNYIVIEGNIGAGKTTLCNRIAAEFDAKLILEQFSDNPFLPKFYENPERYSFSLELSFLAARYKQLNDEIQDADLFKNFTIADYYFVKSLIFSRFTLQDDEYNLYRQLFNIIYQQLPSPNLYVYVHRNVDVLLKHIKDRGRDYEKGITRDYLLQVQEGYFNYFKTVNKFPVVIVDASEMDFVNKEQDYNALLNVIFEKEFEIGVHKLKL